jgi:8-oxo-dGTP diphosphatase
MRTAARAIIIKDDQLLVMDRNKFGTKYCALVGGGVDMGETIEQALVREIREETSLEISNPRLVIIEDAGDIFGTQYIYLCDYLSGEVKLDPLSTEAQINEAGQNIYNPIWLPLKDLEAANLLPLQLKEAVIGFIKNGFPIKLTIVY